MSKFIYCIKNKNKIFFEHKLCEDKEKKLLDCLKNNDQKIKYCYKQRYLYEICLIKNTNKENR